MTPAEARQYATQMDARIARRIQAVRVARGVTQRDLAAQVGMCRESICMVEHGRAGRQRRKVGVSEALVIAEALGIQLADLIGEAEPDLAAITPRVRS